MSLEDLEKQTGISKSTISRIERGELSPSWENVGSLVSGLGLPLEAAFEAGIIDWFGNNKPRAFYGSLAPKLVNISCRLDDDLSEGYIWITTPDGIFEPTIEEVERLDDESDNYLKFLLKQLIEANPNRFRPIKKGFESE